MLEYCASENITPLMISPSKLAMVSGLLPIRSTRYRPTKVKTKLTAAVTADSQTAASSLFTPDILMIVAL